MNKIKKNIIKDSSKILTKVKKCNIKHTAKINNHPLIKKIFKCTKEIIKKKYEYDIKSENFVYNKYSNLLDFSFIDKKIITNINKIIKKVYIVQYKKINIKIFHKTKTLNKKIKKIISNILHIVLILKKLFKNTDNINVSMFFSNLKKKFPKKNNVIAPINCNSGLTYYPSGDNGQIVIFREEEYCKVLFHEGIHALKGDKELWDKYLNDKIYNKYCLDFFEMSHININETYTEFLANILHINFIACELKLTKKNINNLFKYESIYSLIKAKQIFDFYGYEDISKIYRNKKCKVFNQKSNVLSYYIFKTSLFFNYNKSLDFYNEESNNFKIKKESVEKFINLINSSTQYLLFQLISNMNIKNFKNKSLRMTLFQLC